MEWTYPHILNFFLKSTEIQDGDSYKYIAINPGHKPLRLLAPRPINYMFLYAHLSANKKYITVI